MSSLSDALTGAGVALVGFLAAVVAAVGPFLVQYLKSAIQLKHEQIEAARHKMRNDASDLGVAAAEEIGRREGLDGAGKAALAAKIADGLTPRDVTVSSEAIAASVARMRASVPSASLTSSSMPPGLYSIVAAAAPSPTPAYPGVDMPLPRDPRVPMAAFGDETTRREKGQR